MRPDGYKISATSEIIFINKPNTIAISRCESLERVSGKNGRPLMMLKRALARPDWSRGNNERKEPFQPKGRLRIPNQAEIQISSREFISLMLLGNTKSDSLSGVKK